MPTLTIANDYSHLFGRAVLEHLHLSLHREIAHILTTTLIPPMTKPSKEKTKVGQSVYSGKDFNTPLSIALKGAGWEPRRLVYDQSQSYSTTVDFTKGRVGLELQFGKYAFVQHDFYKFQYMFQLRLENTIDVGVEIVAVANLQRKMYTGPANFESVVAALRAHARNEPPVPIWLIVVDVI